MQPFRFAPLAVLLLACLSACDSGALPAAAPAQLSEAIPFDARIIARAAALDDSRPQAPLEASYTSADRPLYTFASQEDFEQAADALSRLAKWGGEPLNIHGRLRSLNLNDFFAPGPENALLDENGEVIIGGNRVTLRIVSGEPVGEVTDAVTGEARETFRSDVRSLEEIRAAIGSGSNGEAQGRISRNAEDAFGVYPNMNSTPVNPGIPFRVRDAFGMDWDMWFVYAHSAYVTYTGAKRVKAASEAVIAGPGIPFTSAITAPRDNFPTLKVYAAVLTEDHGCRTYSNDSYSSGRIEIEIGGSRGTGQGVIESLHRQVATTTGRMFGFNSALDGENNNWPRCGRLSS